MKTVRVVENINLMQHRRVFTESGLNRDSEHYKKKTGLLKARSKWSWEYFEGENKQLNIFYISEHMRYAREFRCHLCQLKRSRVRSIKNQNYEPRYCKRTNPPLTHKIFGRYLDLLYR